MPTPAHILCVAALLASPCSLAQSASISLDNPCPKETAPASLPSLSYDAVSIHPHPPEDGSLFFTPHLHEASLTITGVSLRSLVTIAYSINDYQLSGGSPNLLMQRYDLRATSDAANNSILAKLTDCQASLVKAQMLQALLAERLKLTVHRATKEVSGYTLVVAKSGPKMHESHPNPAANPAAPNPGSMRMRAVKAGTTATFHSYSLTAFTDWLGASLNAPLADKTGLTAQYDITLQFTLNTLDATGSAPADAFPDLFTALPEQLGLKLEPTKVSVDTVAIDHIEPPTEN